MNFEKVIEYIVGCDLFELSNKIGSMTENMVRFIMVQIIDIVQKLAKNHVAHRDIKDENIMINLSTYQGNFLTNWTIAKSVILMVWKFSRNRHFRRNVFFEESYFSVIFVQIWLVKNFEVKLIDFGCAIEFCDNDLFTSFSGTSEFYPYEWFNSGYYCPIGGAVWSIGCLMFTLLTGKI